jgi:hypothetical protein
MEPISATIVAAIAGGAAVALKDVANKAISDTYQAIKTLIIDKYKRKGAIEALEEDPQSDDAKKLLTGALEKAGADRDEEIIKLAQQLSEALSQMPKEEAAKYLIDAEGFTAANVLFKNIKTSLDGLARLKDTNIAGNLIVEGIETGVSSKDPKKK